MAYSNKINPIALSALQSLKYTPYWLDDPDKPDPEPALTSAADTDLLVIGGGFSGLWTALLAKERDRSREVMLIEAGEIANAATGRNGGFVAASLTHGVENGLSRWPKEMAVLTALGQKNLKEIGETVRRLGIDCDYLESGELNVATESYQAQGMREFVETANKYGENFRWLDAHEVRSEVNSPLYKGALFTPHVAMVNPARLAWGLRKACLDSDVKIFENTSALKLEDTKNAINVTTQFGVIKAKKVALATNAFPPLLSNLRGYIVPVYDYVLMTEPLSPSHRDAIGWRSRQGVGDAANQFHYYRTTADGRILWGGYDAIYYPNDGVGPHLEKNWQTFAKLATHFFETFPQLEGLHFSHAWGGAIDTSSRFSPFWGTTYKGKLAYSLGFTGLGVGSTRFGALVMLDLLESAKTERTTLEMVRTKPMPFPPEPLRSAVINFTRWSLDQADQNQGRRNLWLRLLDMMGLGFDS